MIVMADILDQLWWLKPKILALRRQKQEEYSKLSVSLFYIVSSRPANPPQKKKLFLKTPVTKHLRHKIQSTLCVFVCEFSHAI